MLVLVALASLAAATPSTAADRHEFVPSRGISATATASVVLLQSAIVPMRDASGDPRQHVTTIRLADSRYLAKIVDFE